MAVYMNRIWALANMLALDKIVTVVAWIAFAALACGIRVSYTLYLVSLDQYSFFYVGRIVNVATANITIKQ